MHPTHVIDFIDYKLPEYQKRYDESKAKHDAMLANYESKNWFVKIFTDHPASYDWDYWWVGSWIEQLRQLQNEAIYKSKMEYESMEIDKTWHKLFYKWARDNNIPY